MTAPGPTTPAHPGSLVLVGAGKMGGSMLEGWLAAGLPAARVTVLEPRPSDDLSARAVGSGLRLVADATGLAPPEVLVLAVKPQMLGEVADALRPLVGPDTTLVSVLAGKTADDLARALPGTAAIVRAMPNLPASIGRGATGVYATPGTSEPQRRVADALLRASGLVEWLDDEAMIDAVTAVSGSGPAYLFHMVESLAAAGEAAGLPAAVAARLARATITGAAALLDETGEDPAVLRRNVTSPGGTTAAALAVLTAPDGMGPLMERAVAAARRRAGELAG